MKAQEHGYILARLMIALLIMSGVGLNWSLGVHAQESPPAPDTFIIIDSPFKLWNGFEKALDKNFTVNIWLPQALNNSTNNYIIRVNNNYTNGSFSNHHVQRYLLSNVSRIEVLEVIVNNETKLLATGIRVMSGVTQNQIDQGSKPFMISLLPSEWTSKEWRIFWSIVSSAILCCFISYRLIVRYRKARGVTEIR